MIRDAKSHAVIVSAVSGVLALGLTVATSQAQEKQPDMEKCAGIVKAGKNDCHTDNNMCAGMVEKDGDKLAWILVPKGTCEKIVGGKVVASNEKK